jgi:hypothetical protein
VEHTLLLGINHAKIISLEQDGHQTYQIDSATLTAKAYIARSTTVNYSGHTSEHSLALSQEPDTPHQQHL